jgi:hypothetical protein
LTHESPLYYLRSPQSSLRAWGRFTQIFVQRRPILGVIHLPPLPG